MMKLALAFVLAQRIISLSPSVTEILYGIDAFDQVIAVSSYCEYPPEVESLPRVGGWTDTNLEQVLSLAPDLVILTGVDAQAPLMEPKLTALGIETLAVGSQSLDDIFGAIMTIGEAVGKAPNAEALVSQMRRELEAIRVKTQGLPRPKVLVVVDRLPGTLRDMYIATGESYLTELIEIAGGEPIRPEAPHNYMNLSTEALVVFNPEVIFDMVQALTKPTVVGGGKFAENPVEVWNAIDVRAVEQERVYHLTDKRHVHPSQFAIGTVREFARRLHPEVFE
jgi:iron complex transport system substrate-binding protein